MSAAIFKNMDPEFQRLVTKEAVSESDSSDNEARQDAEDEEFRKELAALPADVRAKILAELGEVEEAAGGSDAEASSDDDDEQDDMEEGSHIDVMGINLRLNEFGILPGRPHALEWIETLDHTWTDSCAERITNVEDEPAREAIFQEQALAAILEARPKVLACGIPFERPEDFYAEMLKTDQHMSKIRKSVQDREQGMKRAEEVALIRKQKRFGKQVQAEKLQERARERAEAADRMKLIRKGRANMPTANDDEFGVSIDEAMEDEDDKRRARQSKYGQGGPKSKAAMRKAGPTSGARRGSAPSGPGSARFGDRPSGSAGAKGGSAPKFAGKARSRGGSAGAKRRPGKTARSNRSGRK
ncbi:hypothetical protein H696_03853 [Fonticula alba]|uniref:Uncharacterized protein n=1 Tax=Fonticula alba TaxID=691883 RepID=A0A058Z674_FONAL|nr:hypothetical protein H696_03853 [Fonticula alba]KCV69423.1 hypothetical protein H696_03853 [Fonticula alba]|eukprot:XP_009495988.1 hypothetical protein H696_03853 [Fonticula alba]